MYFKSILVMIIGLFVICCSMMNFDWFFCNKRAYVFVKTFGRKGARIIYLMLGIMIFIGGLFISFAPAGSP